LRDIAGIAEAVDTRESVTYEKASSLFAVCRYSRPMPLDYSENTMSIDNEEVTAELTRTAASVSMIGVVGDCEDGK
jgi:hypothetical protein